MNSNLKQKQSTKKVTPTRIELVTNRLLVSTSKPVLCSWAMGLKGWRRFPSEECDQHLRNYYINYNTEQRLQTKNDPDQI